MLAGQLKFPGECPGIFPEPSFWRLFVRPVAFLPAEIIVYCIQFTGQKLLIFIEECDNFFSIIPKGKNTENFGLARAKGKNELASMSIQEKASVRTLKTTSKEMTLTFSLLA